MTQTEQLTQADTPPRRAIFLPGYSEATGDIDGIEKALQESGFGYDEVQVFKPWELSRLNWRFRQARQKRHELAEAAPGAEVFAHSLGHNLVRRCIDATAYHLLHAPKVSSPRQLIQGMNADGEQAQAIRDKQGEPSDREVEIQQHLADYDNRPKESNLSLADKIRQWVQFPRMMMTDRIKLAQELKRRNPGAEVTIGASKDDAYFPLDDQEIARANELEIPLIEMAGTHSELAWRPVAYLKEYYRKLRS